jgi:transposase
MRPYSTDFRLKVVRAYEHGEGSQRDLARIFGVSLSFIQDLLQRYRQTGIWASSTTCTSSSPTPRWLSAVKGWPRQPRYVSGARRCSAS